MTLKIGDKAPNFSMPTDNDETVTLSDYNGTMLILYFYPKDDTPGCTKQACGFTESLSKFNGVNCNVLGVSKDGVAKHKKFKEKYNLNFPLASDEGGDVCERYGVYGEKSMYGKKYMGITRTTFLIDEAGIVKHIWHKVKVDGHIDDVLKTINKEA